MFWIHAKYIEIYITRADIIKIIMIPETRKKRSVVWYDFENIKIVLYDLSLIKCV